MDIPEGSVTVTNFSATVTGSGTNFDTEWEGKWIRFGNNNEWYEVDEVDSVTSMTLKMNYRGPTAAGQQYIIGGDIGWKRQDLRLTIFKNKNNTKILLSLA